MALKRPDHFNLALDDGATQRPRAQSMPNMHLDPLSMAKPAPTPEPLPTPPQSDEDTLAILRQTLAAVFGSSEEADKMMKEASMTPVRPAEEAAKKRTYYAPPPAWNPARPFSWSNIYGPPAPHTPQLTAETLGHILQPPRVLETIVQAWMTQIPEPDPDSDVPLLMEPLPPMRWNRATEEFLWRERSVPDHTDMVLERQRREQAAASARTWDDVPAALRPIGAEMGYGAGPQKPRRSELAWFAWVEEENREWRRSRWLRVKQLRSKMAVVESGH